MGSLMCRPTIQVGELEGGLGLRAEEIPAAGGHLAHGLYGSRAAEAPLTIPFALLPSFFFILRINVFCLGDPVQVALKILFQLLLLPELLEVSPCFCFLPFLRELSEGGKENRYMSDVPGTGPESRLPGRTAVLRQDTQHHIQPHEHTRRPHTWTGHTAVPSQARLWGSELQRPRQCTCTSLRKPAPLGSSVLPTSQGPKHHVLS